MKWFFSLIRNQYDRYIAYLNKPQKITEGLFKGDLPAYDSATSLEMVAFRCCDKRMFEYARSRRRKALIEGGFKPWF